MANRTKIAQSKFLFFLETFQSTRDLESSLALFLLLRFYVTKLSEFATSDLPREWLKWLDGIKLVTPETPRLSASAASGITRTSEATNCTDISDSQGDLS